MDYSKYPIERFVYYIAGIIPGFVAILVFHLAVPGSFGWFFSLSFLGYRTKVCISLVLAFVIGHTITSCLRGILGAIDGAVGASAAGRPYKLPHSYAVAPWRDRRWRIAMKKYLGADAPNDTHVMSEELLQLKHQGVNFLPEGERPVALQALNMEKLNSEIDDSRWAEWYDHYHTIVLFGQDKRDFDSYVANGLNVNLASASVYILLSALFVPSVRHWWYILPACIWALIYASVEYSGFANLKNYWSTLNKQIEYLVAQEPLNSSRESS